MISVRCLPRTFGANFPFPLMKSARTHGVKYVYNVRKGRRGGVVLTSPLEGYKTVEREWQVLLKMLRNSRVCLDLKAVRALYLVLLVFCIIVQLNASPTQLVKESTTPTAESSTENSSETSPDSDLYVIKAVVYEIGILTDADNSTGESTERQEEVNISFYDRSTGKDESPVLPGSPIPLLFNARNLTS